MLRGAGKVALVTGGSSGIGLAAVRALTDAGVRVYETSRRDIDLPGGAIHIKGDVTEESSMERAVKTVLEAEGKLDILLCCAGFGISGAVEFTRLEDAKRQFEVNFFGVVNAVKAALPAMRRAGRGRIVIVSSVAGAIPIPFQTYYSATKAAINAYTSALSNEVRPYGVTVTAVMPGDIATGFTDARVKSHEGNGQYGGRIDRSVSKMEHDERSGMSPDTAGRYLTDMCLRRSVPVKSTIGATYKLLVSLAKLLPQGLVSKVVYMMYAK